MPPPHRALIKASLGGGVVRFAYQFAHEIQFSRGEIEKARMVPAIGEASDAVTITNLEGVVEYVNSAVTRMTGHDAADLLGRRFFRGKLGLGLRQPTPYL